MTPKIEAALLRFYADCSKDLRIGDDYPLAVDGMLLRIMALPPGGLTIKPVTPVETDTYDAVRLLINLHQRRVTFKEIFRELQLVKAVGDDPWSESAVWKALASLCHKKLLENDHDRRGYGLGINSADRHTIGDHSH